MSTLTEVSFNLNIGHATILFDSIIESSKYEISNGMIACDLYSRNGFDDGKIMIEITLDDVIDFIKMGMKIR